jgi:ubiquinone/menaquinone biosynthesis C-methylase UbiE
VTGSRRYSTEPDDPHAYTARNDRLYSRLAGAYDLVVKVLPTWRRWLRRALPHIEGPRVLEVSFGTGWLLTQYAGRVDADGIDLNPDLVGVARRNLARAGVSARLREGTVESLPYPDGSFDTVVNTMAFTGYPDGARAAAELSRVLRPGGRLVLIDVGYPNDDNRIGRWLVEVWRRAGDLIRDIPAVLAAGGFTVDDEEIGGCGSVHLYLGVKTVTAAREAP